jgi:hypothetical protein
MNKYQWAELAATLTAMAILVIVFVSVYHLVGFEVSLLVALAVLIVANE